MKITVDTKDLNQAITQIKPLKINKQMPFLGDIMVNIGDGEIALAMSDMERTVVSKVEGSIDHKDNVLAMLIPLKNLTTFLHGEDGNISIEKTSDNKIILSRDGMGECTIYDPHDFRDFPPLSNTDGLHWTLIDAHTLCSMLKIAIPACAQEDNRPILTGIDCTDGAIASADGFRLVAIENERFTFGLGTSHAIIPVNTARTICRLFSKSDNLKIAFRQQSTSETVFLSSDKINLSSQLVLGTFPKYHQLIPENYDTRISFSAPLMAQRLGMIEATTAHITRFQFIKGEKDEVCTISARVEEIVEYNLNMPVKIGSGGDSKIAFNKPYIQEVCRHFSMINLDLTTMSSPGKFTGDIEGVTIVVMPMFVQW